MIGKSVSSLPNNLIVIYVLKVQGYNGKISIQQNALIKSVEEHKFATDFPANCDSILPETNVWKKENCLDCGFSSKQLRLYSPQI